MQALGHPWPAWFSPCLPGVTNVLLPGWWPPAPATADLGFPGCLRRRLHRLWSGLPLATSREGTISISPVIKAKHRPVLPFRDPSCLSADQAELQLGLGSWELLFPLAASRSGLGLSPHRGPCSGSQTWQDRKPLI